MDVRIVTVVAGLVAGLVGVVFLAPDLFAFAGLPESFAGLGLERVVTGLALLLLGFIGVLSELDPQPKRRRRPRPGPIFAFEEQPAPAGPASAFDPLDHPLDRPFTPAATPGETVPERDTVDDIGPVPEVKPELTPAPQAPPLRLVEQPPQVIEPVEPAVRMVYEQPEPELPFDPPGGPRRDPPAD